MSPNAAPDARAINVLKGLVMDATRKANSGHPGGAMSSADFAYILFKDFLRFDPDDPTWFNRDRFVLSAGHESMLLYSLLFFRGLLSIEDLTHFRQWGSRTPGHPERDHTPGVEATTGPLGQGFGMAVGMAVAETMLRARLGADVVDHYTYVLASDGDLQEPICLGAASLAGLWGLGRLIVFHDSNKIQLAGPTNRSDCTDYAKVFAGFCWQVIDIDGHDHAQIRKAVTDAKLETAKPTLIVCHTDMAKGAYSVEGDFNTHGAPMAPEEIAATKKKFGLDPEAFFQAPADALESFRARFPALREAAQKWRGNLEAKVDQDADFTSLWREIKRAPGNRELAWPVFEPGTKVATRKAWGDCLNKLADQLHFLCGGSADLDPSNQTVKFRELTKVFSAANPTGRALAFGVREFPMGAVANGLALHGGIIPFGATFLVFSDYERNALRMSALQKLPVLHVFTHDSFHVGEDGPTHQPVEHVSSLRLIPNMLVLRPADATETAVCLSVALAQTDRPSCLLLTRQSLPVLDPKKYPAIADGAKYGGYVLADPPKGKPELILLSCGSETHLALDTAALLTEYKVRVVNMPSMEIFDAQPQSYKDQVLPPSVAKRAAVEAGRGELWRKYTGCDAPVLCIDHFCHSAPASVLVKEYGFTPENFAGMIRKQYPVKNKK
jgi:transketolase